MAQRRLTTDQTRASILTAARELLANPCGISAFTMEAVAKQARVARMTVYYQFQSKRGLVEALFEDVARRGNAAGVKEAFREHDPRDALQEFVTRLAQFWSSDRLIIRRLRHVAALEPDIHEVLRARDDRRRHGLRIILQRWFREQGRANPDELDELVHVLQTLTSFETYDQLAGTGSSPDRVAALLWRLVVSITKWHSS